MHWLFATRMRPRLASACPKLRKWHLLRTGCNGFTAVGYIAVARSVELRL